MKQTLSLATMAVVVMLTACSGPAATTSSMLQASTAGDASGATTDPQPTISTQTPTATPVMAIAAPTRVVPSDSAPAAGPGKIPTAVAVPRFQATPAVDSAPRSIGSNSSPDDRNTRLVTLYWLDGETLRPVQRRIPQTQRIATAAIEALLQGPAPGDGEGLNTALPTPREVLAYAGRDASWGPRVTLRQVSITGGVATADFSRELRAYGGGSARSGLIRQQITRTLEQFSTVHEVRIAIEGDVAGALQP